MHKYTRIKVLVAEPESAKALFRCGQLNLRLKNIEAAKVCTFDYSRNVQAVQYLPI